MPKKSKEIQTAGGAYRFGEFELYPAERQLNRRQAPVPLSPKVFDALLLFVQNAGHLVHRDRLIEALWPDTFVTDANLTNVIVTLRKILGRESIRTVSKFGYRFSLPVLAEPGINESIYATFVKAKELVLLRSIESTMRARDLLALCVAEDPSFATAWAWLGRCCRFLEKFNTDPSVNRELAEAAFRRALAIDPHLACAHNFYTQLQVDCGHSRDAMVRLVERVQDREEPESFAGLVHALRFCGLLEESVAAHTRATALDPTIVTSVPHTHFLRCDYPATLDTYGATRYYLDASTWAAMGDRARARSLLQERLATQALSPLMGRMMRSLLLTVEGRRDEALQVMSEMHIEREPETLFYLSRHYAMLGIVDDCVRIVARARSEGFTSSFALLHDEAFAPVRAATPFQREVNEVQSAERLSRAAFDRAGGLKYQPAARSQV